MAMDTEIQTILGHYPFHVQITLLRIPSFLWWYDWRTCPKNISFVGMLFISFVRNDSSVLVLSLNQKWSWIVLSSLIWVWRCWTMLSFLFNQGVSFIDLIDDNLIHSRMDELRVRGRGERQNGKEWREKIGRRRDWMAANVGYTYILVSH